MSTVATLRPWQSKGIDTFFNTATRDFLCVATPGAGKTRFALECMKKEQAFYVVVVPTSGLRVQWADDAWAQGLNLDPTFENRLVEPARDVHGIVVTYQSVVAASAVYRRLVGQRPTFVVLDEIHHCGEKKAWGDAVLHAFEVAERCLLLSGTPFRRTNEPIPFVRYEGDPPRSRADYSYDYRLALRDGAVRPIEFACWSGTAKWMQAGEIREAALDEVPDGDEGKALSSALMLTSEWMSEVLPEANRRLQLLRQDIHDAGGLIVAKDQAHAREIAKRMSTLSGVQVPYAVSDDQDAHATIERFKKSKEPWLVAVNMVSEGVDIPRLMVGVYATLSRSELFFKQVVGRFVRVRGTEADSYPSTVFMPSVPSLVTLAREIEKDRDHELAIESTSCMGKQGTQQQIFDIVQPLAAVDGHHHATIYNGDDYSDQELRHAEQLLDEHGAKGMSPTVLAQILRAHAGNKLVGTATLDTKPLYREKETLRADVNKLVNRLARALKQQEGREMYASVWNDLHNVIGVRPLKNYSVEDLERATETLSGWLANA